jgi:hypothetical protein
VHDPLCFSGQPGSGHLNDARRAPGLQFCLTLTSAYPHAAFSPSIAGAFAAPVPQPAPVLGPPTITDFKTSWADDPASFVSLTDIRTSGSRQMVVSGMLTGQGEPGKAKSGNMLRFVCPPASWRNPCPQACTLPVTVQCCRQTTPGQLKIFEPAFAGTPPQAQSRLDPSTTG